MEHVKQQAISKRKVKINDLAEQLQVKKFVLRTWEKELGLVADGGFYGAEQVELLKKIKQLILVERRTIEQVRDAISRESCEGSSRDAMIVPAERMSTGVAGAIDFYAPDALGVEKSLPEIVVVEPDNNHKKFLAELAFFKQELLKFQELLKT